MYFKLCFYIANATYVFLSSILDILRERGIPHQIYPSTYHPWLHGNWFSCKSCITKFPPIPFLLYISFERPIHIYHSGLTRRSSQNFVIIY